MEIDIFPVADAMALEYSFGDAACEYPLIKPLSMCRRRTHAVAISATGAGG